MAVAEGADEPSPEKLTITNGLTFGGAGFMGKVTISGIGSIRGACFGPYDMTGIGTGWPGTPWAPHTPTCPPPLQPTVIPPVIIGPGVPREYPLPEPGTITLEETEFFKDWMAAIERAKAEKEREEKEKAMKAEEVYKITESEVEEKRPGFTERVVLLFTCLYEIFKPLLVWPVKATVAAAKLPVKVTKLGVRAVKHTTLVMMPPALFVTTVVLTVTGPRWIKWCCEVGGWPYAEPGTMGSDWTGFYILAVLLNAATIMFLLYHVFFRILENKWWWPTPNKD